MRIYQNLKEALNEAERDVAEMGILVHPKSWQDQDVSGREDFDTKELQNYIYTVSTPRSADIWGLTTQPWADDEFGERVSPIPLNPGQAYKKRLEVWSQFLHHGKFSYTYSERLHGRENNLRGVIARLRKDPESRQGFISIWDPSMDIPRLGGVSRVPCTLGYYVQVRKGKLNLTYLQRSCDLKTHFPNDVYLAVKLQEYIASALGVEVGTFTHWIGSLHVFKKDVEDVF